MIKNKNTDKKILIIDDEKHIAEGIRLNLRMLGHNPLIASNGREGLNLWKEFKPDLVIVDLMMPEIDGVGVITELRRQDAKLPILVISAKDHVKEKIRCLSLGVDDYISKPFDLDEFLLRVDRLLTRNNWSNENKISSEINLPEVLDFNLDFFSFGNNQIDFKNLSAMARNTKVDLTLNEIKILKVFITHQNKILTREEILEKALGYDRGVTTRTLDNFIVRFRKYFEDDPKKPVFFKSVRSVGYIFDIDNNK